LIVSFSAVTMLSCWRSDTVICGHVNHSYLLTYLLNVNELSTPACKNSIPAISNCCLKSVML